MRQLLKHLSLIALVCIGFGQAALAQVTSATLNGLVSDPAGAAIPGVQIQIQNLDTGLIAEAVTNDFGVYSSATLPPGRYTLTAQKEGFQKSVQTGIVLTVSQVATLNVTLKIGSVNQSVTVTANEEVIDVTNADLSNEVNESAVKELPLNGRDPSTLVLLSPGTTNVLNTSGGWSQTTNIFPDETGASSGGGRQGSTYYLLDGMSNMDPYSALAQPAPNADATQEFRVITTNFDAQYGFSPAAVVTLQTKSGTNTFHGGLFEFIRNNDLNAADYFSHTVNLLKRNQFGGYVGGPVIKNKLFFFANYQATRTNSTISTGSFDSPTTAMRNGDFSAVSQTLPPPFATVNGKPNQINPNLFNPAMVMVVSLGLPPGQDPATGLLRYTGPPQTVSYNEDTDRLDYTINSKQRLFVRSFIQTYSQPGGDIKGNLIAVNNGQTGHDYNEVLNHAWTINDTTVNSFTFGYGQMDTLAQQEAQTSDGNSFCWSKYIAITEPAGQCFLEGFTWDGGGSNWTEPIAQRRWTWGLSDSFIKTMGNLTLTAGVDVHKVFSQEATEYPSAPLMYFGSAFTGNGLADLLLGDPFYFSQGGGELIPLKGWQPGFYLQGQYRFKPNLTVTAGLRWDPYLPPASVGGRGANFVPGAQSTMFPNAPAGLLFPGDQGITAAFMPKELNLYEPRIGLAWRPGFLPNTAIRAGFGVFTGVVSWNNYNHLVDIAPFSPTFDLNGSPAYPINAAAPWASGPATGSPGSNPFPPFASVGYKPPANYTFTLPVGVETSFASDFQPFTTTSWSLSIEQQLTRVIALHLAYVGSETDHASIVVDQNPGDTNPADATFAQRTKYPDFTSISQWQSVATSPYNALEVGVDKRMSHGLQVQSNFTWSKVLDYGDWDATPNANDPIDLRWNYGISGLNVPLAWVSNFIYKSPSLRSWNVFARGALGSWEVSSIYTIQSGRPFSISGDGGSPGTQSGSLQGGELADKVPGVSRNVKSGGEQHWLRQYVNPAAFSNNANGTFGDSGHNILTTPHINTADSAISKNWEFAERYGVQLRIDMFNTFNHASFGTPDTNIGDGGGYVGGVWTPNPNGNFGHITGSGEIPARVMQGALKFSF